MKRNFENIGIHVPEIKLPAGGVDLRSWSVVACDQYTSQPAYWDAVEKMVHGKPSTFHITLPEIYLKEKDVSQRINAINQNMLEYLEKSILVKQSPGFVLVDRSTSHVDSRKGLILAVDLEKYDYNRGSQSLIRATEGTVLDRIPPRVKIRENAPLELPHILILIDDPGKTVIEPLFEDTDNFTKLYDFDLMMDGGHITGWKIDDEKTISNVVNALVKLADKESFREKYNMAPGNADSGMADNGVLLFAVGDGNHSLATAKAHWENVKKAEGLDSNSDHPARYALAEIVNVHDDGIVFEPIHRVLFDVNADDVLAEIADAGAEIIKFSANDTSEKIAKELTDEASSYEAGEQACKPHIIRYIKEDGYGLIVFKKPTATLEVGSLQAIVDKLEEKYPQMQVDYIHGDDVVTNLGSQPGNIGFYLPSMDKNDLFKTVIKEGALPRKTFSMGEAEEKRYYLECRKIR
jgi:hypothetical protein